MRTITKDEYLQAIGLLTIAKTHYVSLIEIEKILARTLKEKKDIGSYGHISDCIWGGDYDIDELLEKMDIKVCKK